jgi:hypothetical protein
MEVTNHYYTDQQTEIFEDIQSGFPETEEGDFTCESLFDPGGQHIESLINQCEHSGKYSQDELILFVETVRTEGI